MGNIINKIIENNVLFVCVIVGLCLVLVVLILLIIRSVRENRKINIYEEELEDEDIKKVKNVKKEDIIESPDRAKKEIEEEKTKNEEKVEKVEEIKDDKNDKEIEERYTKEKEKEIEEIKEEKHSNQIQELLNKMEEDSKLSPEDVVANFEKEQEAQSIISYKELLKAVKNRQDIDYEDELESKPLTTVSDFLKQKESKEKEPIDFSSFEYEENNNPEKEKINEVSEVLDERHLEGTDTKFKKTEIISPIYGRLEEVLENDDIDMGKTIDLRDIDLSDIDFIDEKDTEPNDAAIAALDDIYKRMASDLFKNENVGETTSLDALARNEEFLQSLKDFRKKL